jgi:hypothetical protein
MVLSIQRVNEDTVSISWKAVSGISHYDLYWSATAYFSATDTIWHTVSDPESTQLNFTDGVGDQYKNYFFRGRTRAQSVSSPAWNIVGEFDLGMDIPLPVEATQAEESRR